MSDIISTLVKEFNLKPFQVENTVKLIDSGIPFLYCKVQERNNGRIERSGAKAAS